MFQTTRTAPVKGLDDYVFEKTRVASFNGPDRISHAWRNTRTEDYATKFATKAQAVESARKFEKGLQAEARGVAYTEQFADAPVSWIEDEIARIEPTLWHGPGTAEDKCYRAGLVAGYRAILAAREG